MDRHAAKDGKHGMLPSYLSETSVEYSFWKFETS